MRNAVVCLPVLVSIAIVTLFSTIASAQNSERVIFNTSDSANDYYLAVRPQNNQIGGVIVLLSSFLPPENILAETKLHNVAYANNTLTVFAPMKQKLYLDDFSLKRINLILKDIVTRFSADTSKFVLAGYDEAGNIALRYTELAYEQPDKFPVQPKATFCIDAPVDLFKLWHWSERQIKKNYWPGAVGDARYYINNMTKENGTIYNNPQRYKELTPFSSDDSTTGNEKYLAKVPLRLYYDTDIEWQLQNRRNSFYDTKMPDASELISRLLLLGNDKAEFISSKYPGVRSDGTRRPNALSIVDEVDCIQWIKKTLNIFDARTWVPPYNFAIPNNWNVERFPLPPDFARQIIYKGIEDVRFAPGWSDVKSEEHWAYCFLWFLDGTPHVDAESLKENLTEYYSGLVGRNIISGNIPKDKVVPTNVVIKKIKANPNDLETYSGTINMLDYHTQKPIALNCLIHIKDTKAINKTVLFFEISPQATTHPVWKKMDDIGASFQFK